MNDTPRTDAAMNDVGSKGVDWHHSATLMAAHARQLERELNEARKQQEAKVTPALIMDYAKVQQERNQLLAELKHIQNLVPANECLTFLTTSQYIEAYITRLRAAIDAAMKGNKP